MKSSRLWYGFIAIALLIGILAPVSIYVASHYMQPDELDQTMLPAPPREDPQEMPLPAMEFFQDLTSNSGVNFTCRNGEEADHFTLLESLGSGVALIDFDGDGLLDIFLIGGGYFGGKDRKEILGYPCKLYKNMGNW
ncbi:MAG TPA: hypothetical protein VG097_04965, partial [Gemmata sp.]|nr:hypothetical protein [Gemmata sp.]